VQSAGSVTALTDKDGIERMKRFGSGLGVDSRRISFPHKFANSFGYIHVCSANQLFVHFLDFNANLSLRQQLNLESLGKSVATCLSVLFRNL